MKMTKEELKRRYCPNEGLVIITILGFVGIFMLFISNIFKVRNFDMLYECFADKGIAIIGGLFFTIMCLYCWIGYFRNFVLKPKKEILYLLKNEGDTSIFLNKKGRSFNFDLFYLSANKYYYVMKTHDYIYEILGEYNMQLPQVPPKEVKKYWLNLYTPFINLEDILILPIIYVMALPGVISFFISKGTDKIYGILFSGAPLFIIIYDLISKINIKKNNQ